MSSLYIIIGVCLIIGLGIKYLENRFGGSDNPVSWRSGKWKNYKKTTHDETISNFEGYEDSLYEKCYLMTKRESLFFRKLSEYTKDKDYIICPKVRVEDVIGVSKTNGMRLWGISGKLDRSHIDFVLIGKTDLKTKFAIELDDSTHDSYYAKKHDRIKNDAFECTSIKLIRFDDPNVSPEEFLRKGIV
ncbi:DUF2726 domain-containing protein [Candidatus Gracilibacteria bacterium]|nr:DUF2726 domain-containing protein [Candidatus Gracilibacteria bacterium]